MYLSVTDMTDNVCIFCLDEQRSPHRIPCGHSFCRECFERYLEVGLDTRCPLCRKDFRPPHAEGEPPARSTVQFPLEERPAVLDLIEDLETLPNDTLVLTLTEQECRFFEELYRETQYQY